MAAKLDHTFMAEFHALPRSDRRALFNAMGVKNVDSRDDEQFYGWLADRYSGGEGQSVDAAIHKSLSKPQDRGLDAALCNWLSRHTNRRRVPNCTSDERRARIRNMTRLVVSNGGSDLIVQLRALAPNYPWLAIEGIEEADEDHSFGEDAVDLPESPATGSGSLPTEPIPAEEVQAEASYEGAAYANLSTGTEVEDYGGVLDR